MKTKPAVKTLLFSVAALALSACSDQRQEPAPKAVVSNDVTNAADANRHFAERIDWASRPTARAILYPDLLNRGDAVGERADDIVHRSSQYEWFAYIDYAPGAYFRHPTSYAFLTYEDPKIKLLPASNLPTLNYEPVWPRVSQTLHDVQVVYSDCWLDTAPTRSLSEIEAATPEEWPPRMAADACKNQRRAYGILVHNISDLDTSPETVENLELMASALAANGYNILEFRNEQAGGEKRPYLDLSTSNGGGLYQLKNFVNSHIDFNDCCEEIVFYLTGETSKDKQGYSTVLGFDIPFLYKGENGSREAKKQFMAEDLAIIIDQLKTCHLNVVIDANEADLYADDLLRVPNTESVLVACQEGEYTYAAAIDELASGQFLDPFGVSEGERGSEFTSSVAKAFYDVAKKRGEDSNPSKASDLILAAFEGVKRYDIAFLANQTTPRLRGRDLDSHCPCGIDQPASKR